MSNNQVKKIVIVGGGTAGWLSANYLNRFLNSGVNSDKRVCITLIESPEIGTISVGESTVPTLRTTMAYLGLDEQEWMTRCNATFKSGIKFVDWVKSSDSGANNFYWHPFERPPSIKKFDLAYYWLKRRRLGNTEPLAYACAVTPTLSDVKKSPKLLDDPSYKATYPYAYHLDATKLTFYLAEVAVQKGVTHLTDKVLDVSFDERGYISYLRTEKNGDIFADLFIDCSGFRSLLINQALKEPFISFSDSLFCDSAIAMPMRTDPDNKEINTFTTATALRAGWAWDVPLFARKGVGYVYSSNFISNEVAESELRRFLGVQGVDIEARHIKFRVGRQRNCWVKNCVAIGLASGFIEPLEATGIYLIEIALKLLVDHFPGKQFEPKIIARYNRVMAGVYEDIRDFIVLHYCTTNREDTPFWAANKHQSVIPETLRNKLELWQYGLPSRNDLTSTLVLFDETSYLYILAGMGYLPHQDLPILDYLDDEAGERAFLSIKNRTKLALLINPDHYQYHSLIHSKKNSFIESNHEQVNDAIQFIKKAGHKYFSDIGQYLLENLSEKDLVANTSFFSRKHPLLSALARRKDLDFEPNKLLLAINIAMQEKGMC